MERLPPPSVRKLSEMREVIYDRAWLETAQDLELYYMHRGVFLSGRDKQIMDEIGVRYDITVIPPRTLGVEYVKTAGHYHPNVPGQELTYPEIYEVLEGEAHYLLQKPGSRYEIVEDVVLVEAKAGDKVVIPPNYGHITINPSNRVLRMSNFVSTRFSSIYDPIKKLGGAAYFELVGGKFVRNERYERVPELRFEKPFSMGFKRGEEMYGIIRKDPSKLDFLNNPQNYTWDVY